MIIHPQLNGFVSNSKYVTPEVIYADLKRIYKQKTIELADIIEWCARVETLHLADVSKMIYFEADEFIVTNNMIQLPCHLHKILDVYTDTNSSSSIISKYGNNGSYLYGLGSNIKNGDKIYLNYIGIAVTEEGMPLVLKSHVEACGFFCRCRMFEEDMSNGDFPANQWQMWDSKFSISCRAANQSFVEFDRSYVNNLLKIRGNMIYKIGKTTLLNNQIY